MQGARPMHTPRTQHLLPVLALAVAGCSFNTPTPTVPRAIAGDGAPPARLDVSSVDVVATTGTVDAKTAAAVRAQTTKILADAARKSGTGDGHARIHVKVSLGDSLDYVARDMRQDGLALMFWAFAAPYGLNFGRQALSIDIAVTRSGRTFAGHGEAQKGGSIYAPARKRALAFALDRALADAARHERLD
jgi:hypothetical protein